MQIGPSEYQLINGVQRPVTGGYPPGVINGPEPTTRRGWKRRIENVGKGLKTHPAVEEPVARKAA